MILLHLKLEGRRVNGSRMTMDVPNGAVSYDNNGVFLTQVGRAAYSLCFDQDDEIAVLPLPVVIQGNLPVWEAFAAVHAKPVMLARKRDQTATLVETPDYLPIWREFAMVEA